MKTTLRSLIIIIALLLTGTSCTREDDIHAITEDNEPTAYITDSIYYQSIGMTAYNFVYPSVDPLGNSVMLSGTITIGDSVKRHENALGLILYNHFTIYRADQCPSRGELTIQKLIAKGKLITISPDYYGFGHTDNHHQAYCISRANAQSSVDALLAAKQLLKEMDFTWNDYLFNTGYSQGAQTAIGVVRLVDEKYPDIDISHTFAGAGPYDIPEIYRQFLSSSISGMPSTVISVLLSYNEFYKLNVPFDQMFINPLLSNIDNWIFSKEYTREEIDALIGSLNIEDYIAPTLLDTTTDVSQRLIRAMDDDNLCKRWSPDRNQRIYLFHNTKDITVPVAATVNLHHFLLGQGLSNVTLDTADYGTTEFIPAHEMGAAPFLIHSIGIMCDMLGITPWVR